MFAALMSLGATLKMLPLSLLRPLELIVRIRGTSFDPLFLGRIVNTANVALLSAQMLVVHSVICPSDTPLFSRLKHQNLLLLLPFLLDLSFDYRHQNY